MASTETAPGIPVGSNEALRNRGCVSGLVQQVNGGGCDGRVTSSAQSNNEGAGTSRHRLLYDCGVYPSYPLFPVS